MCLTCGCGEPDADHGDPRHITMQQLKDAADAAEIDVDEAELPGHLSEGEVVSISLRNKEQNRAWTFKEWIQGKPFGHPSHPLFVHFPIAFYTAALVFDVMTAIEPNPALNLAATYLLLGAALATVILVITGLVDWWGMVRGSSKRRTATRHLLFQFTAAIFFQATLVLRFADRAQPQAETAWIVLEAIGYLFLIVGQYLGGVLVYEKAMRVSTGGAASEPDERPARV